jgi:methylated-DNA-[protein]-cysteine S-methyltransferase
MDNRRNGGFPEREGMQPPHHFFDAVPSPFGAIAIVWWNAQSGPRVRRILLCGREPADRAVRGLFPEAGSQSAAGIEELGGRIQQFLAGRDLAFDPGMVAMEDCGAFQRRILTAEHGIPRGWISTYGRLAKRGGAAGGGRAAGRALATNPFPIVIPCHRTVRADGGLGGYQGGWQMKRALLEMEGVAFDQTGRVLMERIFYD